MSIMSELLDEERGLFKGYGDKIWEEEETEILKKEKEMEKLYDKQFD